MVPNYDYLSSIVYSQIHLGCRGNHLASFGSFLASWTSRSVDLKAVVAGLGSGRTVSCRLKIELRLCRS